MMFMFDSRDAGAAPILGGEIKLWAHIHIYVKYARICEAFYMAVVGVCVRLRIHFRWLNNEKFIIYMAFSANISKAR